MTPPVPHRPPTGIVGNGDRGSRAGGPADVAVTGATSALGRRVCRRLVADPDVGRVVAIDVVASDQAGVEGHAVASGDLKEVIEGVAVVVHLGASGGLDLDGTGAGPDVVLTRQVLDAAGSCAVPRIVLLSSAAVYGAWPNNPIPLTEDAPLRPSPDLPFAVARAEEERLVADWLDAHPGASGVALRTSLTAGEDTQMWMARSPWPRAGVRAGDREPPAQFLHLDDLAAALDLARTAPMSGALNVAPDGWIPPDALRDLVAPAPRVRLPEAAASRLADLRFRAGLSDLPPGVLAYTIHPWVVANDRIRAVGWSASHTNEEAFVAGHRASALATMSPRRRQELSLFATGALVASVVAGVTLVVRRRRRASA